MNNYSNYNQPDEEIEDPANQEDYPDTEDLETDDEDFNDDEDIDIDTVDSDEIPDGDDVDLERAE